MADYTTLGILCLQLITLLIVSILAFRVFFREAKRSKAVKRNSSTQLTTPLPSGHNWVTDPLEVVNEIGVFDRWLCIDCNSWVDKRRGEPWTVDNRLVSGQH